MPKSPSTELFDLIQSLTKVEKAAFKIYARNKGAQNSLYVKLFDHVEKRKKYDEKKIAGALKLKPGRLAELKNYLYNLVLNSLNEFHSEKTINARLAKHLTVIKLVLEKGLFGQCGKLIQKAKIKKYYGLRLNEN